MSIEERDYRMKIEEMKKRKKELGYTNEMVAQKSGIPLSTVQKIFAGTTQSPRYDTIIALEKVLGDLSYIDSVNSPDYVYNASQREESENIVSYDKKQGEYTLDDYIKLPNDQRVELIDGMFYNMSAPTSIHQILAAEIWRPIMSYITNEGGSCTPFISPIDVQLDCDEKTVVQPDVIIVCDRNKLTVPRIVGAPDFVVEIISPASMKKDMFIKLNKYMNAGVREYWIVDPKDKKILVYDFEHESFPRSYTFDDTVPVGIFDGKCAVDFRTISSFIDSRFQPSPS